MPHTSSFARQDGADLEVVPVVTAGAYVAGNVIGGVMAFPGLLPEDFNGRLQSLTIKFKGSIAAGGFVVAVFGAQPVGTFNDHGAPVINAADSANLIGMYSLPTAFSQLGTHTLYSLDLTGKEFIGNSQGLWAVVIAVGTPTPASASDMSLRIGVEW